jgi:hypothetical protein
MFQINSMAIDSPEPQRIQLHIYHSAVSMALNLTWQVRREDQPELVPPHAICWLDRGIKRSPIQVTVRPGRISAASARFLLQSHTLVAGELQQLALFFQDEYSNWVSPSEAARLARVTITRDAASPDEPPALLPFSEGDNAPHGGPQVPVVLTRSGTYAVHLHILEAQELFATYYADSSFGEPLVAVPVPVVDFSRAAEPPLRGDDAHTPPVLAGFAYNSSLSVRWSGFIQASLKCVMAAPTCARH